MMTLPYRIDRRIDRRIDLRTAGPSKHRGAAPWRRLALLAAAFALGACQPRSNALLETSFSARYSRGRALALGRRFRRGRLGPGHAAAGTPLTRPRGTARRVCGGLLWGLEDTFRHVEGVVATAVGYAGGHTKRPTYEDVCSHSTGHAETTLVEFDPKRVTYAQLLQVFWDSHDPTTPNQQGPDIGDQYRSAIFTFSEAQSAAARESLAAQQAHTKAKVTTEIQSMGAFWKAEAYHQQFDERTGRRSCPLPRHAKAT